MKRAYRHYFWDNSRWNGFRHREGDVVICSSYRSGTTWMQRICSLLIFQSTGLPRPLTQISPWLELVAHPVDEIHALYESQLHQRFIKSHTPFDGLPYHPGSRYIFIGRDPRDIFVSLFHHLQNSSPEFSRRLLQESGIEPVPPRGEPPQDFSAFLDEWLHQGCFPFEDNGWPYWSVFSHAQSFWDSRHLPNVMLIHYDEMQADLEDAMQRIADFIGVEINLSQREELAQAAKFAAMKTNADFLVPDCDIEAWVNNEKFFNQGRSGLWRSEFTDSDLVKFCERSRQLVNHDLSVWLHSNMFSEKNQ